MTYTLPYALKGNNGEQSVMDVAAYEYDPLGSIAFGKDEVRVCLDACIEEMNGKQP